MNDSRNFYAAITYGAMATGSGAVNSAALIFDNKNIGGPRLVPGDDALLVSSEYGFRGITIVSSEEDPNCPMNAICSVFGTAVAGINNGYSAIGQEDKANVFEFLASAKNE